MRAWQVHKHAEPREALSLVEVAVPEPGPGELRIQVEAAGLGLPDVFMCRGRYAYQPTLPFTPGQEVAGIVSAAGPGAATAIGTRVMAVTAFFLGHGGLAEEALALEASTHPVPEEMSATEAAGFVIPYHTAYLGLKVRGRIEPGETLLVLGAAGGSGTAAVQMGRALGGQATGGAGADVIYAPVGGEAFDAALECIANEGRLLAVGYASGAWSDASTSALVRRNASVVGVFVGAYRKPFLSDVHDELLAYWRDGRIRSLVSSAVDFEEVSSALGEIAMRRTTGKLVAKVAPGGNP